jgi:DNA polymerase elongation subunit (family B)
MTGSESKLPTFRVFKWEEIQEDDERKFHAWAFHADGPRAGQRALLRVQGHPEEFYIELPGTRWSQGWIDAVVGTLFNGRMSSDFEITTEEHFKYYYYSTEPTTFIRIRTMQPKLKGWLVKKLKTPLRVFGMELNLRPAEHKISSLRKLLTARNIDHCSFIKADVMERDEYERVAVDQIPYEYTVEAQDIHPAPDFVPTVPIRPCVGAFDIETYSDNHRAMPEAMLVAHEIYLIQYAVELELGNPETRKAWVLSTRAPKHITHFVDSSSEGDVTVEVRHFKSELEMIRGFEQLIQETNPDVFTGYNIHSYDIPYIKDRLDTIYNTAPGILGRLSGELTEFVEPPAWKSSAYGINEEIWYGLKGRISLDMYKLIKRDHRLLKYTLKFVTEHFLDRVKIDLPAARQFEIYENGNEEEWDLLLRYAGRDAVCLLDLFKHFDVWVASMEMANVAKVSIEDLYSRGQQIRMEACVYHEAHHRNYVVDRPDLPEGDDYEGAIVQNPIPGYYEKVITLDFSSLYPSIVIALNICPSTFVFPGTPYNPEDVNEIPITNEDGSTVTHRFVKDHIRQGILPTLLRNFLQARAKTKKEMKAAKNDPALYTILDARQQAYKVSANSGYGFLGARNGRLPLLEGAASVTAMGRYLITQVADYMRDHHNAFIRYGDTDSVMVYVPDAPDDLLELRKYGEALAKEITGVINRPPIAIAFENIYIRFLVFSKKMYIAVKVNEKGELMLDDLVYKGVAMARREHSEWVRRLYKEVTDMIMVRRATREQIYEYLDGEILKLLTGQVGYNPVKNVTKRDEFVMVKGLGAYSAESTYFMKTYAEQEAARGRPHKAGERVSVIVTRTQPGMLQESKIGIRLRDPEDEDVVNCHLDKYYYLANNLNGPITRILETLYGQVPGAPIKPDALPTKLEFSRKRKTELPPIPYDIKNAPRMGAPTPGSLAPTPGSLEFSSQKTPIRKWLDEWLKDIIMPATLSTNHIDTWMKLIQVKERWLEEVISVQGRPKPRPMPALKKGTRKPRAAGTTATTGIRMGKLTLVPFNHAG